MKKGKKIRIILIVVCVLAAAYGIVRLIQIYTGYHQAEVLYEELRDEVVRTAAPEMINPPVESAAAQTAVPEATQSVSAEPDPPEVPVIIDFERLRQINAESVGWIYIPDTNISYPLMRGEDNEKYLVRAYDDSYSGGGSIFLDYRNAADLSDRHSIIYGHNMQDDSMFGQLSEFSRQDYVDAHPYVYLLTQDRTLKYRIFSVYITSADYNSYELDFSGDEDYAGYLTQLESYSWLDTGHTPDADDPAITLSTCVNDKSRRRVIHAALVDEWPTPSIRPAD
jgi:sortase B